MIAVAFGIIDNILAIFVTGHFVRALYYRLLFGFIAIGAAVTAWRVVSHRRERLKLFLDLFGLALQLASVLVVVLRVLYVGLSF